MLEFVLVTFSLYFVLPFTLIIDLESDISHHAKRKIYYIFAIKSCILPGIIGTLSTGLLCFLIHYLGYGCYSYIASIFYCFIFIFCQLFSFTTYQHCYPKDNNVNNGNSTNQKLL